MMAIELTTYCDGKGYSERPDFLKDIWPFFQSRQDLVTGIYELKRSNFLNRIMGKNDIQYTNFGNMVQIQSKNLEYVKEMTCYGEHLSVVYKVVLNVDGKSFLKEWPYKKVVNFENKFKARGSKYLSIIYGLLGDLRNEESLIIFSHDADPFYIINNDSVLERLKSELG